MKRNSDSDDSESSMPKQARFGSNFDPTDVANGYEDYERFLGSQNTPCPSTSNEANSQTTRQTSFADEWTGFGYEDEPSNIRPPGDPVSYAFDKKAETQVFIENAIQNLQGPRAELDSGIESDRLSVSGYEADESALDSVSDQEAVKQANIEKIIANPVIEHIDYTQDQKVVMTLGFNADQKDSEEVSAARAPAISTLLQNAASTSGLNVDIPSNLKFPEQVSPMLATSQDFQDIFNDEVDFDASTSENMGSTSMATTSTSTTSISTQTDQEYSVVVPLSSVPVIEEITL